MKKENTKTRRPVAMPARPASRDGVDPASVIGSTVTITVMRISEAINRLAERDFGRRYGLKNTDRRILVNLAEPSPVTIGELSRRVRIDKAWISRSLKPLVARRLVRIATDPSMPRAKFVSLTLRGKQLLAEMAPTTLRRTRQLLEGVDQGAAEAILDRMLDNMTSVEDELMGPDEFGGFP